MIARPCSASPPPPLSAVSHRAQRCRGLISAYLCPRHCSHSLLLSEPSLCSHYCFHLPRVEVDIPAQSVDTRKDQNQDLPLPWADIPRPLCRCGPGSWQPSLPGPPLLFGLQAAKWNIPSILRSRSHTPSRRPLSLSLPSWRWQFKGQAVPAINSSAKEVQVKTQP